VRSVGYASNHCSIFMKGIWPVQLTCNGPENPAYL